MRDSTRETLSRAGYEVTACTCGPDAISVLEKENIELILCDMKMPGMSGMEVLEKSRKVNGAIPFIIMTAYGSIETAVLAMKKGAFDFIEKPFASPEQLELLVERGIAFNELKTENQTLRKENEAFKKLRQARSGALEDSPEKADIPPSDAPRRKSLFLPNRWAFILLAFNLTAIGILLLFLLQRPAP